MLRYYESQGLLRARRGGNGYRIYTQADLERAATIGKLIRSGLPSRLIAVVLSMDGHGWVAECRQTFADIIGAELASLEEKIACLSHSRAVLRAYLAKVDRGSAAQATRRRPRRATER
ncbi:MAG: MerR family transcriptional regulator [Solimonas sp.]